jgi:hypothetical protein
MRFSLWDGVRLQLSVGQELALNLMLAVLAVTQSVDISGTICSLQPKTLTALVVGVGDLDHAGPRCYPLMLRLRQPWQPSALQPTVAARYAHENIAPRRS